MSKRKVILVWVLRIIVSIAFILASLGKLTSAPQVIDMFKEWGFPDGFYLIIGILEIGLAVLLLIPKVSLYAAIGLTVIMIGALITHLIHDPIIQVLRPLIFMLFLGGIIFLLKNEGKLKSTS